MSTRTKLEDLARFSRQEVEKLAAIAAGQGVTTKAMAKIAGAKLGAAFRARGEEKRASPTSGKEVQTPGILRSSASSAWRMGVSAPKPKTTTPGTGAEGKARGTPAAKPPSKTAFYSDIIKSLNNPQRGFRQSKPEG